MEEDELSIRRQRDESDEPIVGEYFYKIKNQVDDYGKFKLDDQSKTQLYNETRRIYKHLRFSGETGLVVGKIQSGKTMSFEALTGLARDNQVPIFIILAGVSDILVKQTAKRFRKDFADPKLDLDIQKTMLPIGYDQKINRSIEIWLDPSSKEIFKTAHIIVVMKQKDHLDNLAETLSKIRKINDVNVLIVDDEADQYGLNVGKDEEETSAIFNGILKVRDQVKKHTYLQYTATPAANMLVALDNILSPSFAVNINPGFEYTELSDLFRNNSPYTQIIRESDVDGDLDDDGAPDEELMPDDLKEALKIYIIGVVSGYMRQKEFKNRSMLVHPSRLQKDHKQHRDWIHNELELYKDILGEKESSDYAGLIKELENAHNNLDSTVDQLESFDEMLDWIPMVLNKIELHIINASKHRTVKKDEEIDWDNHYAQIICSGTAVDRGTTVEGLTVTYMPRPASKTQDTQIQRARFLGYRKNYKSFIRIYLDPDTKNFYETYHLVELSIRQLIDDYADVDDFRKVVREWKLNKDYHSCRKQAVKIASHKIIKGNAKWSAPRLPYYNKDNSLEKNRALVERFVEDRASHFVDLDDNDYFGNAPYTDHSAAEVSLNDVYKNLLTDIAFPHERDARYWGDQFLYLKYLYDELGSEYSAKVYLISKTVGNEWVSRKRSINSNEKKPGTYGNVLGIQQSSNQARGYPGDRSLFEDDKLSIQIHNLEVYEDREKIKLIERNVPLIAIRLPDKISNEFDIQKASSDESDDG